MLIYNLASIAGLVCFVYNMNKPHRTIEMLCNLTTVQLWIGRIMTFLFSTFLVYFDAFMIAYLIAALSLGIYHSSFKMGLRNLNTATHLVLDTRIFGLLRFLYKDNIVIGMKILGKGDLTEAQAKFLFPRRFSNIAEEYWEGHNKLQNKFLA